MQTYETSFLHLFLPNSMDSVVLLAWGGNSPSTAQTGARLKPLFCPAQRPKILTLYLRYIAVKNTCWQKLTALLPRSGPRGRGARKFGDMTL